MVVLEVEVGVAAGLAAHRVALVEPVLQPLRVVAAIARELGQQLAVAGDGTHLGVGEHRPGDRDRDRPHARDLAALALADVTAAQRGLVAHEVRRRRLARAADDECVQRVGGVGLARLVAAGRPGLSEDQVGLGVEGCLDLGALVGRQAPLPAGGAVAVDPLPQRSAVVQALRPGRVVGLGRGAHTPAAVLQPLHRGAPPGRAHQLGLGAGVLPGGAGDLVGLGL